MSQIIFANNAASTLASPILAAATTLTVAAGQGALFPAPTAGQYFALTIADAGTGLLREIVHCTNVTGDVLTIVRAQEGTIARAYVQFDPVANLWTAAQAAAMVQSATLGTASTLNASDQLGTVSAVQVYAGNPNGHVAGVAAVVGTSAPSSVWDTINKIFWVCIGTGSAAAAIWMATTSTAGVTFCGTATGTANAIILTPAVPLASYVAGQSISFIVATNNSSAVTINTSGLGVRNLFKESPTGPIALTGGELIAGNLVMARDDGTRWQLTATELGTAALANASSNTGTLVAVSGSVAVGHLAVFSDTFGTVVDGGLAGVAASPTAIDFTSNGLTLGAGVYNVDTTTASGGAFSINLPASPANGQSLTFYDIYGIFDTNMFTISGNGHTISAPLGSDTTLICNTRGLAIELQYNTALTVWEVF